MARELVETFEAKEVHPEALAALRLFHEAAQREEATPDLALRIGGYLLQARHAPGLRFTALSDPVAAAGVHDAASVDHGLRVTAVTPPVGIHDAARRGDRGGQEKSDDGGEEEKSAHGMISGVAPADKTTAPATAPPTMRPARKSSTIPPPSAGPLTLATTGFGADSVEAGMAHLDLARYQGVAGEPGASSTVKSRNAAAATPEPSSWPARRASSRRDRRSTAVRR